MLAHVIGVSRISGNKNSRDYDMARVVILVPAESREGTTKDGNPYIVRAYGWDTAELDLSADSVHKFEKLSYPCMLELITDSEVRFGRVQSVVTGFSQEGKA